MVTIEALSTSDKSLISDIADLHKRAFPTFFLTQLGKPFLRTLYKSYVNDPDSGIIVAEENRVIVGFIAYSNDYSLFYKRLIKKNLLSFAVCSLGAAIRHPSFIKRLFGAFKKSESVTRVEPYVELASICVDPSREGCGIGSLLIDNLKSIVDFDRYEYINLETDAMNNEMANKFYIKNGFKLFRQFTTAEGRSMNEYRFVPDNSYHSENVSA